MQHEEGAPGKHGVRTGFIMIGAAIALSPLANLLGELMPSRENTIIDELPSTLLLMALAGIGLAGAAKVVHSLIAEHRKPRLEPPDLFDKLAAPRQDRVQASVSLKDRDHRVE